MLPIDSCFTLRTRSLQAVLMFSVIVFSLRTFKYVLLDVGIVVHTSDGVVECEVLKSVYQDKDLLHYYTLCATLERQCVEIDII